MWTEPLDGAAPLTMRTSLSAHQLSFVWLSELIQPGLTGHSFRIRIPDLIARSNNPSAPNQIDPPFLQHYQVPSAE